MTDVRRLDGPPGAATLYPRAVAGSFALPLLRRVPLLGPRPADGLPDVELALDDVDLDRERLARYARVCGFPVRDTLPATYLHVLAFPLAMRLMTDGGFPFGVLGLVHVENAITHVRPVTADERPSISVRAEDLRDHPRGTQFDLVAEATIDGETVWTGRSTYLRRGGGGGSKDGRRGDRPEPPQPAAVWDVPGDIGRRYGAVSGDRNPIHLHALSARVFGQPGAIAHGMWLKARCLAALEPSLPGAYAVEVAFKRPVVLPAKVAFSTARDDDARAFALHDARRGIPHLEGRVAPSAVG
jgi:acyl dehydratase